MEMIMQIPELNNKKCLIKIKKANVINVDVCTGFRNIIANLFT